MSIKNKSAKTRSARSASASSASASKTTVRNISVRDTSVPKSSQKPRKAGVSLDGLATRKTSDGDKRIYEAIFNAVRSQQLPPGTKLTENSLSELFGVSRTIVRKALQKLAHEHIVELRPNRGATIASPSRQETSEVFAARRAIEAAILPLVVKNATKAQLVRLKQHIRKEHQAFETGDRHNWIRLTGEFHLMLGEIGGNRVLSRYLSELVSRCSLIIAMYDSSTSVPCDNDEHDLLIDLMAAQDIKGVVQMMDRHLLGIEQRLDLNSDSSAINLAQILKISST